MTDSALASSEAHGQGVRLKPRKLMDESLVD